MADDVNKAKKRQLPKQIQEHIEERDRRISYDYLSNDDRYAAMIEREEKINGAQADIKALLAKASSKAERDILTSQYQESALLMDQTHKSMDEFESSHAMRQNSILADRIKTYTNVRNVNQRTTTMAGEQRFFRMARASEDIYAPTEVLEQRIGSSTKELTSLGHELTGRMRGIGTGEVPESLLDKAGRIQELQEDIALNKRMIKLQSKEGLSTEKRQYAATDTLNRVGSVLDTNALRSEVASGKYGSLQEETDKLSSLFSRLNQALSKFEEVSENATDAQGRLTDEYKQASAELDKMQKETEKQRRIVSEVERHGGGGSSSSALLEGMPGLRRMVSAAYGTDIDDKITEMNLKAAAGQTAVDQYNRVNASASGDMRAMLRESSSQDFIKAFSDDMRQKAIRMGMANTAVAAPDAIAKGVGQLTNLDPSGVFTAGAGVMETFRSGMAVARGIPQTTKALEAYRAAENLSGVNLEVRAQGLQAIYDQAMATRSATIGAGGSAQAMEQTLLSPEYLSMMANMGMSPGQAAQLSGMSIGQLGNREAATDVARRAARAQQTGLMSADSFIGMAGQLSSSGGGSADLEKIMSNAVAAGMDSAKNVQQMVSATVSLSGNLSKMGVSGVSGAAGMLGAFTQDLRKAGVDPNIAAIAAESQLQLREQMDAHKGMDLGTMMKFRQIRQQFPEASTMQMELMAGLTATELNNFDSDKGLQASLPFLKDSDRRRQLGQISADATKTNIGFGTIATSTEDQEVALRLQKMRRETTINLVGRDAEEKTLGITDSHGRRLQEEAAKRQSMIYSSAAGGDINSVLTDISTVLKALSENLSPEKAQKNVETASADMKAVGPVMSDAGKAFSGAAAEFSSAVKQFDQTLKSVKLPEHMVNRPSVDSTRGHTFKGSKQ